MQAIFAFIQHIAASLIILGHALLFAFIPMTAPAQNSPTPSAAATSSTPVKLFPVAGKVKPVATSSATQANSAARATGHESASPKEQAGQNLPEKPIALLPQSVVNDSARSALVNIFCITKSGGYLYPISGSGVLVTKNGVILTNAHVGQYFLLRDYVVPNNVDCRIRTGNPAQNMYYAELLYLPPAWVNANASQITAQESMGTGQDDYAFLRITSPIDESKPLPASFPALSMTTDDPARDEAVLLASYPAGFLNGILIATNLYMSTVLTQISDIFAFDNRGNADLISLGASVVAQAGSSGGAVVRQQDGSLQGIIATESETASTTSTAARDLHAITLGHIERSLRQAGISGIAGLLTGDLQAKADDFAKNTAPGERQKLVDALNKH